MDKEKIQYIVAGVLILVFLFVILNPPAKEESATEEVTFNISTQNFSSILALHAKVTQQAWDPANLQKVVEGFSQVPVARDPFEFKMVTEPIVVEEEEPEDTVEVSVPDFVVQGVLFNKDRPEESIAIVAGKEVGVGSMIDGWKIIEIQDNVIIVQKQKTRHSISLYS